MTYDPDDWRPEEPLGLGAVVRCEWGVTVVRVDDRKRPWVQSGSAPTNRLGWDELDPVEVLSEGVTP